MNLRHTNLPIVLTSFVGRHREIDDISQLLASARLVSLVGPGGCGKTRLALRVATQIAGQQSHDIRWVDLARLLFDTVLENGGVWHLYGHSWEIHELNLWEELRIVLDFVSNRPGVLYLCNGSVVRLGAMQPTTMALCSERPAL